MPSGRSRPGPPVKRSNTTAKHMTSLLIPRCVQPCENSSLPVPVCKGVRCLQVVGVNDDGSLHLDTKEEASADLCVDAADFDPENPPDMSAFLESSEDEDEDEEDESEEEDDYEEDLEVCCAAGFAADACCNAAHSASHPRPRRPRAQSEDSDRSDEEGAEEPGGFLVYEDDEADAGVAALSVRRRGARVAFAFSAVNRVRVLPSHEHE